MSIPSFIETLSRPVANLIHQGQRIIADAMKPPKAKKPHHVASPPDRFVKTRPNTVTKEQAALRNMRAQVPGGAPSVFDSLLSRTGTVPQATSPLFVQQKPAKPAPAPFHQAILDRMNGKPLAPPSPRTNYGNAPKLPPQKAPFQKNTVPSAGEEEERRQLELHMEILHRKAPCGTVLIGSASPQQQRRILSHVENPANGMTREHKGVRKEHQRNAALGQAQADGQAPSFIDKGVDLFDQGATFVTMGANYNLRNARTHYLNGNYSGAAGEMTTAVCAVVVSAYTWGSAGVFNVGRRPPTVPPQEPPAGPRPYPSQRYNLPPCPAGPPAAARGIPVPQAGPEQRYNVRPGAPAPVAPTASRVGPAGVDLEKVMSPCRRHHVGGESIPKKAGNSMFTCTQAEVDADMAAIRSGQARWENGRFHTPSGRTYGLEQTERSGVKGYKVHPMQGPGIEDINSQQYKYLKMMRTNPQGARSEMAILKEKGIMTQQQIDQVTRLSQAAGKG